ncbi:MAG: hypothetical protein LBE82_08420 [Chitinophagaceae bacterium]|jgi:hypothetical protein|nr:hypothetical protein [Chitinophagaceae bacterium]
MEVLNENKKAVSSQKDKKAEISKQDFEQMWENAISGDEFVRRAHEHIKKLYALRDKQQADCSIYR